MPSKQLPLNQSAISLEKLAKTPELGNKITYHPSRSRGPDRDILRLNEKNANYLNQIADGSLNRSSALRDAGFYNPKKDFYRAKSAINKLNDKELKELIEWMNTSEYMTT